MKMMFMKGFMISSKICKLYDDLAILSLEEKDNDGIYFEKLDELKDLIRIEDENYSLLSLDDANKYLSVIDHNNLDDRYINRYYLKLISRKNAITYPDLMVSNFSLDSVINSKILIDTLRKTYNSISDMEVLNEDEENFLTELKVYHNTLKYTFFSENEFIEKIGLYFKFDVNNMPVFEMELIKGLFNLDSIDISQESLVYNAMKTIDLIIYSDKKSTVPNVYLALYNVNQLEVLISLLDKLSIAKVIRYYNSCSKDKIKNKVYLRTVRDIISRRRNDFV